MTYCGHAMRCVSLFVLLAAASVGPQAAPEQPPELATRSDETTVSIEIKRKALLRAMKRFRGILRYESGPNENQGNNPLCWLFT